MLMPQFLQAVLYIRIC